MHALSFKRAKRVGAASRVIAHVLSTIRASLICGLRYCTWSRIEKKNSGFAMDGAVVLRKWSEIKRFSILLYWSRKYLVAVDILRRGLPGRLLKMSIRVGQTIEYMSKIRCGRWELRVDDGHSYLHLPLSGPAFSRVTSSTTKCFHRATGLCRGILLLREAQRRWSRLGLPHLSPPAPRSLQHRPSSAPFGLRISPS